MTDTPEAFTSEQYNEVVGAAELVSIFGTNLNFHMNPEQLNTALPKELKLRLKNTLIQPREEGLASAAFTWEVASTHEGRALLHLTATIQVVYRGFGDCQEHAVAAFVSNIGHLAAYPYFRALVGQLNAFSTAALPVVPLLKFSPGNKLRAAPASP